MVKLKYISLAVKFGEDYICIQYEVYSIQTSKAVDIGGNRKCRIFFTYISKAVNIGGKYSFFFTYISNAVKFGGV